MLGRYLKDACRVTVLWTNLALATAAGAVTITSGAEQLIVRTSDSQELEAFVLSADAAVEPLISYPNPSQEVLERFGDYYVVTIPEHSGPASVLAALKAQPWVQTVEPNEVASLEPDLEFPQTLGALDEPEAEPYTPNDPLFSMQWDKTITQTTWAWSIATGSRDVVIAILDSGVDPDHADLEANLVDGYNFVDGNTDCTDDNGHGTRVAGAAAARIDNSKGIAGVAGNASIMPLKVVDAMGSVTRSDVVNAILYAVDNGAKVISMSVGFEGANSAEEDAVEYAWNKGLVLCASAGNDGRVAPEHYPSSYEHVISVGASTKEDTRADFSNYGSNVDVYAPGKSVWLTLPDGGYGTGSGTSFATPQVAGLAALVYSAHPEYTSREVWDAIIGGADTIATSEGTVLRINARKALDGNTPVEAVNETRPKASSVSVSSVQSGTLRFSYETPTSTTYTLRIFDAAGNQVYRKSGKALGSGQIACELALSNGTYFWHFASEQGVQTGKVVFVR